MKNIYFAVSLVFLVLLTFSACTTGGDGDGDSSNSNGGFGGRSSSSKGGQASGKSGACYITYTLTEDYLDVCFQGITESLTRSECNELVEDMNNTPGIPSGTFTADFKNSSCPSGEDYKCHVKGDDGEGYAYLYGSYYDRNSCEELGGTDVGGSTTPSSSSKKASSSSKGGGAQGGYCIFDDYYGTDYYCQEIPPDYDSQSCIDMGGELVNKCPNVPASSSSKKASSSSAAGSTSGTACYIYYEDDGSVDWGVCIKPMNRSECNALAADVFEDDATIKYPDSCPSPKVTCPKSGGRDVYFYGYYAEQEDCDDLF